MPEALCASVITRSLDVARCTAHTVGSVLENLRDGEKDFVVNFGSIDGDLPVIGHHDVGSTACMGELDRRYAGASVPQSSRIRAVVRGSGAPG